MNLLFEFLHGSAGRVKDVEPRAERVAIEIWRPAAGGVAQRADPVLWGIGGMAVRGTAIQRRGNRARSGGSTAGRQTLIRCCWPSCSKGR